MLIAVVALAGLLVGLAMALYFKRRDGRSEQQKRAKKLARILSGESAAGGTGGSGATGVDFGGDD